MLKIRFNYTSSEVYPSIFILLFFRMAGIYMYEDFIDFSKIEKNRLLKLLPHDKVNNHHTEYNDFNLELYYIKDEQDYQWYQNLLANQNNKMIILPRKLAHNQKEEVIYDAFEPNPSKMLNDMIEKMFNMDLISLDKKEELKCCVEIYCKNKLWNLSLLAKYFYLAEDSLQFKENKAKYQKTIQDIFEVLQEKNSSWGDNKTIHLQHFVLNMIYEGNLYCIRHGKSPIYNIESLHSFCKRLLEESKKNNNSMDESFSLLLAQTKDDLLHNPTGAYDFYLESEYNAYSFFRKGICWQDWAQDDKKAIEYYSKSICIYPEYYRAWYRLASCLEKKEQYQDAIKAYQAVGMILDSRLKTKNLRPMEFEYMFKSYYRCACIYKKETDLQIHSLNELLLAEKLWEEIDQSNFFTLFEEEQDSAKKRVKKELSIFRIYKEIGEHAEKMNDFPLAERYSEKIKKLKIKL